MGKMITRERPQRLRPAAHRDPAMEDANSGQRSLLWSIVRPALLVSLALAVFVVIAGGIVAVQLSRGPMPIPFMPRLLASGLTSDLEGLRARVGGTRLVSTAEGLSLQLTDVVLRDDNGRTVAVAPQVGVSLSVAALWQGRIVPETLTFIGPRLRLRQTPTGNLTIALAPSAPQEPGLRGDAARQPSRADAQPTQPLQTGSPQAETAQGQLVAFIDELLANPRRATFFRSVALRRASVILQMNDGSQRTFQVRAAQVGLSDAQRTASKGDASLHGASKSEPSLLATVAIAPLRSGARAVDEGAEVEARFVVSRKPGAGLVIAMRSDNLTMQSLSAFDLLPQPAPLASAPIEATARLNLDADGTFQGGDARVAVRNIRLRPARDARSGAPSYGAPSSSVRGDGQTLVDAATFAIEIPRDLSAVIIGNSRVARAGAYVAFTGRIARSPSGAVAFELNGHDGRLAELRNGAPISNAAGIRVSGGGEQRQLRLTRLRLAGRVEPTRRILTLQEGDLVLGSTASSARGTISLGGADAAQLRVNIGRLPLEAISALWPATLQPDARAWFLANAKKSDPGTGHFQVDTAADPSGALPLRERVTISGELVARNVTLTAWAGMPTVAVPAVTLVFNDGVVRAQAARARVTLPGDKSADLSNVSYRASVLPGAPRPELSLSWQSALDAAVAFARSDQLALLPDATEAQRASGTASAELKILLPTDISPDWRSQTTVTGRIVLRDAAISGPGQAYPVTSGNVTIALDEKVVDLKGRVLVGGVPTDLRWQRLLGRPDAIQPPLRATAVLDDADRRQLKLGTGAILRSGDTPVVLTVRGFDKPPAQRDVHIDVDLTKADVAVASLNWRKPPGVPALLKFDVRPGKTHAVRLDNLRITGPELAVGGMAGLDSRMRLTHVALETLSIKGSRLSLVAKRQTPPRQQNARSGVADANTGGASRASPPPIWTVDVTGSFYDGSDFFRSLFAAGATGADAPRNELGLDLTARIDAVNGFNEAKLQKAEITLSKRGGRMVALTATGRLDGGSSVNVRLRRSGDTAQRQLIATSDDAGNVFRLVDFYPSARGGRMRLQVNLDGSGAAARSGVLTVRNFEVLGDPVIAEVIQNADDGRPVIARGNAGSNKRVLREVINFDLMHAPFSVGHGQFILRDAQLRGPLFGASLRGKADYRNRQLKLGGTYAPLQGLTSVFRVVPGLGQILTGPRGEGLVGLTFAIQGPMDNPEVIVNPLSLAAPGILREVFQMSPLSPQITPSRRQDGQGQAAPDPTVSANPPARRRANDGQAQQPAAQTPAARRPKTPPIPRPRDTPKIIGDWSVKTRKSPDHSVFDVD